jgi:hypothetical protein
MAETKKANKPKHQPSSNSSLQAESSKLNKLQATATAGVQLLQKTGNYSPSELEQLREVSTLATQLSNDLSNSSLPKEEHNGVMDWLAAAGNALLNAAPAILSIVAALL